MKNYRIVVAGIIVAFGLALLFEQGLSAQGEKGAKAFDLVLKSVKVKTTNKDGNAWDVNDGKPDIFVRLKNQTNDAIKPFASETRDDTYETTYNQIAMPVREGQKVEIEVLDKDVAADDVIGRSTMQISADMLKKGSVELTFDQVHSLVFEFRTPK